jgi:hypothetical protein
VNLFPGGEVTGWLDPMVIPKGATGLVLNWGQDISATVVIGSSFLTNPRCEQYGRV